MINRQAQLGVQDVICPTRTCRSLTVSGIHALSLVRSCCRIETVVYCGDLQTMLYVKSITRDSGLNVR